MGADSSLRPMPNNVSRSQSIPPLLVARADISESGLSATIGHPEEFNDWLQSVQTAHRFKHTFIHHPHRYSHLRKFAYVLRGKAPDDFNSLAHHNSTGRMRFLHPVSMLGFGVHELPPDFTLEAADCLSLYEALSAHPSPDTSSDLHTLEPVRFFAGDGTSRLLRQKDILQYENHLKKLLDRLIASEDRNGNQSVLNNVIDRLNDSVVRNADHYAIPDRASFMKNLIYLLSDLHVAGDLVRPLLGPKAALMTKANVHDLGSLRSCSTSIARRANRCVNSCSRI